MKIPYVVSPNTRKVYKTSDFTRASSNEVDRLVVAEDFEWDDRIPVPAPLSYYAALELSKIFHRINPLPHILQKDVDVLMDLYPSIIPLPCSVPLIKDEQYWKRALIERFPSKLEIGIKFYKARYLSAYLQNYLENVNPDVFIAKDASDLASLVSPYIYELRLNQLQIVRQPLPPILTEHDVEDSCEYSVQKVYDHIPLEHPISKLYNLREISITFGINNLEENYQTRFFEFSHADCESLCRGVMSLNHLKIFRINRSNLDCSKVKLILQKLVEMETIEELDFNHCKIGDYGLKALGGFVSIHKGLRVLRIANNRFKEVGVQGIAYALQMTPEAPIELIDFSLNPMSMQCATMFAAAFVRLKTKPQTLIINSCGFRGGSAEKIAGLLSLNRGLTRLDMAANDFSGDAEVTLIKALEQNRNILDIDLRRTYISKEGLAKVEAFLQRNRDLVGQEREPSDEIPPLYLNEPEYLIWEYNPNNPDYIPGRYPERIPEV